MTRWLSVIFAIVISYGQIAGAVDTVKLIPPFEPRNLTIYRGDKVLFKAYDLFKLKADDGSWETPLMYPGDSYLLDTRNLSTGFNGYYDSVRNAAVRGTLNVVTYPAITVTRPNSGDVWYTGRSYSIRWNAASTIRFLKIYLYRGNSYVKTITQRTFNDGSYTWTVDDNLEDGTNYRILIVDKTNSRIGDFSDYFTIRGGGTITVTSPSSGDIWYTGGQYTIRWNSTGSISRVRIELYRGSTLVRTIASSTSNDGSYTWRVDNDLSESSSYRIKISDASNSSVYDYSDYFQIKRPRITVTRPNSGDVWYTGQSYTIRWNSEGPITNVKIELYRGSSRVRTITNSTSNDGSYTWTVDDNLSESSNYRIKISDANNSSIYDYSDYFEIRESEQPSITVTRPRSGDVWYIGQSYSIRWTSTGSISRVRIELYRGSTLVRTITSSTSNDGSYTWRVSSDLSPGSNYKIRISDRDDPGIYGESGYFTINEQSSITVTRPQSGDIWYTGQSYDIEWNSSGSISRVKIELYKSGSRIRTIASSTSNDGRYTWTVSNDLSDGNDYRIKVSDVDNSGIYDYSGTFEIRSSSNECDTSLAVNDYVTLYADCIRYNSSSNYYTLEGHPNINHLIYFTSDVIYNNLLLWGNADIKIPTPLDTILVDLPSMGFEIDVSGDTLTFRNSGLGALSIAGCSTEVSLFKIGNNFVEVAGYLSLPFLKLSINSLVIDRDRGISFDITINNDISYRGFALEDISIVYSQPEDAFSGGLSLKIPALLTFSGGLKILEGELDSIFVMVEPENPVPIDATGLFLTEGGGGISNIRRGPWKVIVCLGVTGGPKILDTEILGASGCFETSPPEYFAARDLTLTLVDRIDLASAEFIYRRRAFDVGFGINLLIVGGDVGARMEDDIIDGRYSGYIGLDSQRVSIGPLVITLPEANLGVDGTFTNNRIQGLFSLDLSGFGFPFIEELTLAYRVEFYPDDIYLYVGTNYDNLIRVTKTADSIVYFKVDAYTPRILVFVGDTGNTEIPVSRVISPSGQVYDSSYRYYAEKDGLGIYIIDAPEYGRWRVEVEEGTSYNVYAFAERPPVLVDFIDTSSGVIDAGNPIEIWAPKDSTCINLYLAEDREDLGTFVGSMCLDRGVNRVNIPLFESGEYYVRAQTTTDPYGFSVYSPFRLRFSQENPAPCPGSITVESQDSGVLIMWDTSGIDTSEILGYSVYFKSSRDRYWTSYGVSRDSNKVFLTDLRGGRNYVFKVGTYDMVGNKSPETCMPVDSIMYLQSANNPPYIADYPKKIRAQVGSIYQYDLTVWDMDGDAFSLYLMHAPPGMYTYGNRLMWNVPDSIMSGRVLLIAHDENGAEDSVEIFYSTVDTSIYKPRLIFDRNVYDTYSSKAVIQYMHLFRRLYGTAKSKMYLADTIIVQVYSKSDPVGLNIPLYEIYPGSGLYNAVIGFTSDPSSGTNLHVEDSDTIFVRYGTLEARAIFTEDPLTPVDYGENPSPGSDKVIFGFELVNLKQGRELVARLSMPEKENVKIEIYSVNGRKVLTPIDGIYDRGLHIIRMDVSSLTTGVYVLRVYTESGKSIYRKFIMLK